MQTTLHATKPSLALRQQRRTVAHRRVQLVRASHSDDGATRRHVVGALLLGSLLLPASGAQARNYLEAKKQAEARKEKLKATAENMKAQGTSSSAFAESKYAVSEDKTPNIHSRQEEGIKSQENI